MKENGRSISDWALDTFGAAGSDARVASRANEEMAELLRITTSDEPEPLSDKAARCEKIAEECADVVIVLARLSHRQGIDLFQAVDAKMKINRERVWERDGTGHGYHVPQEIEGK